MTGEWYIHKNGQQYGPYAWEQLLTYSRTGNVRPEDSVWSASLPGWVRADEVQGLFAGTAPGGIAFAPEEQAGAGEASAGAACTARAGTYPAPAGGELIIGIIPAMRRKTGVLSSQTYTLVVTNRRLIFATLTADALRQAAADAAREAKEQGKGFWGRTKDTMMSQQRIYQAYMNSHPEAILVENAGNYALENSTIDTVFIKSGRFDQDSNRQDDDELHIKTASGKIKLFTQSLHYKETKGILEQAGLNVKRAFI